jgi:hypothetical protein
MVSHTQPISEQIGQLSGDGFRIRLVTRVASLAFRVQLNLRLTPELFGPAFWSSRLFPKLMGVIPNLLF